MVINGTLTGEWNNMYKVTKIEDGYTVAKNGKPIVLVGVGMVKFPTLEEAEQYIRYIAMSEEQYRLGVSD
jgi:hypothetical protein